MPGFCLAEIVLSGCHVLRLKLCLAACRLLLPAHRDFSEYFDGSLEESLKYRNEKQFFASEIWNHPLQTN